MATSSFDSTIKINKKSANSLIKILEEEIYEHVDLNTSIEVKKVNKAHIADFFPKKPKKNKNK
jgi:hypothetical protein